MGWASTLGAKDGDSDSSRTLGSYAHLPGTLSMSSWILILQFITSTLNLGFGLRQVLNYDLEKMIVLWDNCTKNSTKRHGFPHGITNATFCNGGSSLVLRHWKTLQLVNILWLWPNGDEPIGCYSQRKEFLNMKKVAGPSSCLYSKN